MKHLPSLPAHRLLFGLAMAQGALFVVAWVLAGLPLADAVAWHAHEMIFGQALAVVGGYLLSRFAIGPLVTVALLWLAARAAILAPGILGELRAALSVLATAAIALPAALAFLRGAKRPGNLVFPVLLGGFVVADVLFQLGVLRSRDGLRDLPCCVRADARHPAAGRKGRLSRALPRMRGTNGRDTGAIGGDESSKRCGVAGPLDA
jgi:uncharacterized protein involved in response to NO